MPERWYVFQDYRFLTVNTNTLDNNEKDVYLTRMHYGYQIQIAEMIMKSKANGLKFLNK